MADFLEVEGRTVVAYSSDEILSILKKRGWLVGEPSAAQIGWCARAAALLGPQATSAATLTATTPATKAATPAATTATTGAVTTAEAMEGFLGLLFEYDASRILLSREAHAVLTRVGGREVIRMLALFLIDGKALTSDSFSEFVTSVKSDTDLRGPEIFHPMRLALAGRAGDGSLDRLILLLDGAAACKFSVPVKSGRTRIVEFCASLG